MEAADLRGCFAASVEVVAAFADEVKAADFLVCLAGGGVCTLAAAFAGALAGTLACGLAGVALAGVALAGVALAGAITG